MEERHQVAALVVLFVVTLWLVYTLGNAVLWLVWGIAMVGLSGGALVRMNRSAG
ncbi:hypothetical protein [Natronosalvus vescus]|uniref:hypothetical protein n=1 Tax=Natronosalvus vescus TaxID=2953881 RepID=UPI0020911572|nr:hypothetical protein [Natronosalvus vescus]